jgi:uncharacterized protein (TIGR02145 family)
MMRKFYILIMLITAVTFAVAQQPNTVDGFAVAVGIDEVTGTAIVIGQPFDEYVENGDYSVTLGVGQSQLMMEFYIVYIEAGDEYDENGLHFSSTDQSGIYNEHTSEVNGGENNCDVVRIFRIVVEGPFVCGDTIFDIQNNLYSTVELGPYCWMQENLRSTEYATGGAISNAMVYVSALSPDETENEEIYGRLYNWYSAVNIPEGSTLDNSGFVRGACPHKWHIPTAEEISFLRTQLADNIRSTELWVQPNNNNNRTQFTALPAGQFIPGINRFEGLRSVTDFWSVVNDGTVSTALELPYYCDSPILISQDGHKALSVRCIRDY